MDKKETIILIWILSLASLLLIVLYSPVGSPDLYSQNKYSFENQGVAFNGNIENAPAQKLTDINKRNDKEATYSNQQANDELFVVVDSGRSLNKATYSATSTKSVAQNTGKLPTYSKNHTSSNQYQRSGNIRTSSNGGTSRGSGSSGGGSIGSAGGSFSYGSNKNQSNNNPLNQNNGFVITNIDISIFSDSINTPQTGKFSASQETLDTPVPDGFGFLLLLGIGYACFQIVRNKGKCELFEFHGFGKN